MTEFNDRRYYHGSPVLFEPGDTLLPSKALGHGNYPDVYRRRPSQGNYVYHSTAEPEAHYWGTYAERGVENDPPPKSSGRTYTYEVEPQGRVSKDPITLGATRSPKARVKSRIDIPAPDRSRDVVSVQGTLAPMNWKQFGGQNYEEHYEHPFRERSPEPDQWEHSRKLRENVARSADLSKAQVPGQRQLFKPWDLHPTLEEMYRPTFKEHEPD